MADVRSMHGVAKAGLVPAVLMAVRMSDEHSPDATLTTLLTHKS